MNFSIYVLGEVGSFVAALNSVAMVLEAPTSSAARLSSAPWLA